MTSAIFQCHAALAGGKFTRPLAPRVPMSGRHVTVRLREHEDRPMRRLPAFAVMFRIRTSLAYAAKYVVRGALLDMRETRVSRLERSAMAQWRCTPIALM